MPDVLDPVLLKMVMQARRKPRNFVLVVKSADTAGLFVTKKRIKPKEVTALKKEIGGRKVFEGVVEGEGSKLVFKVAEDEPANGTKIIRTIINEQCGLKLKPEFRLVPELEWVDDESEDDDADDSDIIGTAKPTDSLADATGADKGKAADSETLKKYREMLHARQKSLVKGIAWIKEAKPEGGDEVVEKVKRLTVATPKAKSADKLEALARAHDAVLGELKDLMKTAKGSKPVDESASKGDYREWDRYEFNFKHYMESCNGSPFCDQKEVKKALAFRDVGNSNRKANRHEEAVGAYAKAMELCESLLASCRDARGAIQSKLEKDEGCRLLKGIFLQHILGGKHPAPIAPLAKEISGLYATLTTIASGDKGLIAAGEAIPKAAPLVKRWNDTAAKQEKDRLAFEAYLAKTKKEVIPAVKLAKSADLPAPLAKPAEALKAELSVNGKAMGAKDYSATLESCKRITVLAKALLKAEAGLKVDKARFDKACTKFPDLTKFWDFANLAISGGHADKAFDKAYREFHALVVKLNEECDAGNFGAAADRSEEALKLLPPLQKAWKEYDTLLADVKKRWKAIKASVDDALAIPDISGDIKKKRVALKKLHKTFTTAYSAADAYNATKALAALEKSSHAELCAAHVKQRAEKKTFNTAWGKIKDDYEKVASLRPASKKLGKLIVAFNAADRAVDDAIAKLDYVDALKKLPALDAAIDKLWKPYQKQHTAAEKKVNKLTAAKKKVSSVVDQDQTLKDAYSLFAKAVTAAEKTLAAYEFDDCDAACKLGETKLKEYLAAIKAYDKKAKAEAKEARSQIAKLKKSGALQTASLDTKKQLLDKLQSVAEMSKEEMAAQVEIYKSLEIDGDYKKNTKTRRKAIVTDMTGSKADRDELRDHRDNWGSKPDNERLAIIKKALKAQCKSMGVPEPAVVLDTESTSGDGFYSPSKKMITIKTHPKADFSRGLAESLDVVFHENTHHYQAILVERLQSGALKKGDKEYKQAVMFAMNDGPHGYVKPEDDHAVYKSQPSEADAWDNGAESSKAILKAIAKKKKKKKSSSKK